MLSHCQDRIAHISYEQPHWSVTHGLEKENKFFDKASHKIVNQQDTLN